MFDHAESIVNVTKQDMADDLRLAARIVNAYATLRSDVERAAASTTDTVCRNHMREALAEAEA